MSRAVGTGRGTRGANGFGYPISTEEGGADYDHHVTNPSTPRHSYGPGAWPWSFLVSFYGLSTHQSIGRKDIKISVNV